MVQKVFKNRQNPLRVVVKVGTNLISDSKSADGINSRMLEKIAQEVISLQKMGIQVVLVTSGAVHAGSVMLAKNNLKSAKNSKESSDLRRRQALSAIGQNIIISAYQRAMAKLDLPVAQLLLTAGDFQNRRTYTNIVKTMSELINLGVLAIVNENDTIATDELQFGENDLLSAACAAAFRADFLFILTSVDGFFMNNKRVPYIDTLSAEHWQAAKGPETLGRGGMQSKLRAAQLCNLSGINCAILPGDKEKVITQFLAAKDLRTHDVGTFFPAKKSSKMKARKKWLLFSCSRGAVSIDSGARQAIEKQGSSLLAVGIRGLRGHFLSNEVIEIEDETGALLGRGIINYNYREILPMIGKSADELRQENLLWRQKELIHRDNLVMEKQSNVE